MMTATTTSPAATTEKKPRLKTSAMIASIAGEGQRVTANARAPALPCGGAGALLSGAACEASA